MPGFSASAAPATIFIIIIQQLHFAVKQNFLIVAKKFLIVEKNFLFVSLPPRCEIFSDRGGIHGGFAGAATFTGYAY